MIDSFELYKALGYDAAIESEETGIKLDEEGNRKEALKHYRKALNIFDDMNLFGECYRVAQRIGDANLVENYADYIRQNMPMPAEEKSSAVQTTNKKSPIELVLGSIGELNTLLSPLETSISSGYENSLVMSIPKQPKNKNLITKVTETKRTCKIHFYFKYNKTQKQQIRRHQ